MTSDQMITKEDLRKIHLYCYEDVQEFLGISKMLAQETEKPDEEMDKALVEECLQYIDIVMGKDSDIDEEGLDAKFQEVMARASQKEAVAPKKIGRGKKRSVRKFCLVLAATITILFTTLTIAARIYGYKNAWEFVRQKAVELQGFAPGETATGEGITLIGNGNVETFASFEEFLAKEKLDILYPQPLPDGLAIDTISKYSFESGKLYYTLQFAQKEISIMLSSTPSIDTAKLDYIETALINQNIFYILCNNDQSYQAICQTNGWEYTINAPNHETLLTLLQSMKGSES